ncbi:MAG TPA: hypothetical protein DDW65_11145 [Firmicutes bacterium]|jgi:hypothetical protein|nr:hypothetical protein [Bacillota bacterium]
MVYKLSLEEVLQICGSCACFDKDRGLCKEQTVEEPKMVKERHRCKKWDEHFGSVCIFQG